MSFHSNASKIILDGIMKYKFLFIVTVIWSVSLPVISENKGKIKVEPGKIIQLYVNEEGNLDSSDPNVFITKEPSGEGKSGSKVSIAYNFEVKAKAGLKGKREAGKVINLKMGKDGRISSDQSGVKVVEKVDPANPKHKIIEVDIKYPLKDAKLDKIQKK